MKLKIAIALIMTMSSINSFGNVITNTDIFDGIQSSNISLYSAAIGYIRGFFDGVNNNSLILKQDEYFKNHAGIINMITIEKTFLKYMKEHPEDGDYPATSGLGYVLIKMGYAA